MGILISVLLLPLHPIRRLKRVAEPALENLAVQIERTGAALATRDADLAAQALNQLRAVNLNELETTLSAAIEVVRLSPVRWRYRQTLQGWQHGAGLMMRSTVHARPLAVRAVSAIQEEEPIPDSLVQAVRCLAVAIRDVGKGFAPGDKPITASQHAALNAIRLAHVALDDGLGFSGTNMVGQAKTIAVNTLRATGIRKSDAERLEQSVGPGRDTRTLLDSGPESIEPQPGTGR